MAGICVSLFGVRYHQEAQGVKLFDVSYRNALYESKQYILQTSLHNMYLVLLWGLPVGCD